MAPLFLAVDAAHVSSRCDHLLKAINSLRLEWPSTREAKAVHDRIYPLQVTLKELNHGQGLGFTIFTKVHYSVFDSAYGYLHLLGTRGQRLCADIGGHTKCRRSSIRKRST